MIFNFPNKMWVRVSPITPEPDKRFPARGRTPPVDQNMVKPLEMIADGVDLLDGDRREVGF